MGQAAKNAFRPSGNLGRAEVFQTQIQPAVERRMDHRHMRLAFLPAGDGHDFRLRVTKQNLNQFQCRITGGAEDRYACHVDIPLLSGG